MARRPRRTDISRARASQRKSPPIRFLRAWDYVEIERTLTFPAGLVIDPEPPIREAALKAGAAEIHRG